MNYFRVSATIAMLSTLLLAGGPAAAAQATGSRVILLDRIIAVVNEDVITRRDLDDRMKVVNTQLRQQGTPLPPADVLEKQVLDRMIYTKVQLQFAKETGLRVDDGQLDTAIGRIAENNKITPAQLRETLERDGVTFAKFREDIRDEIVMARLKEREVDNKITITDSEVDNVIATLQSQDGKSDEFDLSHILIRVPEQASPEQLRDRRARAEQALAQIRSGTDFRQVAASFSEAPDAVQGGTMGWRELARLPSIFAEVVKPMKVGEVSSILRSPNGLHIVKLNGRRGQEGPVIVSQTHPRHILIKTSEVVSETEARERLVKLKERLDNNADFAELARLQSEDGSASRGGDLGWLSPGDTVPEFEKAMDALKVGQTSGPVRSSFGWHLIQVIERRNEDMSKQQQRLQARMSLREQKADEAYQEWLRQLRDKAFVELRLEER
ncbi:MAG: PpiC-type peptidyl-prolyl cis-trans isomerase [Betaproteobacteria bacterium]|nr:PpiC-type peptidyl-prolyl cis-trans isomerase [Betaproteobacteria bacterium]